MMRRRFFYQRITSGVSIPDNEIRYTSSTGNVVSPHNTDVFGANIISNTYIGNKGVICFDGPVTSIGYHAFFACSDLTSVTIPNSVKSIGYYAFRECDGLTSVIIGNVTSIGDHAFRECDGLTKITCEAVTPPTIYFNTFKNVDTSIPVYVPAESVDAYKSAEYWSEFTNIQAIVN